MAEDPKLAAALKQAKNAGKEKALCFALVMKGSDGALLVDKKKVPPKDIADAKARCGGGVVFDGRCFTEDGKMVFELRKEPPGTLPKLLKTVIQRDAGMTLNVLTRQAADMAEEQEAETPESETSEKSSTPPPAPPPPPGKKVTFDETAFRKVWPVVKQTWQTASEKVDAQLAELIQKMKADPDPEMKQIAELGLNAVTGDFKVPLMAAMRDIDGATGPALQPAVDKARRIVADFRNHLEFDDRVAACEHNNPWDVAVTIQPTLGRALEMMDKALLAVAK